MKPECNGHRNIAHTLLTPPPVGQIIEHHGSMATFRISVVAMTGATIAIDDASATDKIRSIKERVFAANRKLPVRRQRLVYRPGPHGIEPLADDETLGGAGVAQDGTAELDVLLAALTEVEVNALGPKVSRLVSTRKCRGVTSAISFRWRQCCCLRGFSNPHMPTRIVD